MFLVSIPASQAPVEFFTIDGRKWPAELIETRADGSCVYSVSEPADLPDDYKFAWEYPNPTPNWHV